MTGTPYWTYDDLRSGRTSFIGQTYSVANGSNTRSSAWNTVIPFRQASDVAITSPGHVRVTYAAGSTTPAELGTSYQIRTTTRDAPGFFIWQSKNTTLSNVDVGYLHGFGLVSQFSDGLTLSGVNFRAPADSWRTTVAFADLVQVSGNKGKVTIETCNFGYAHDDPINIHGTYLVMTAKNGNTATSSYKHNETAGFPQVYPGDEVALVDRSTMLDTGWQCKVVSVDGPDGRSHNRSLTHITVTFDRD